MPSFFDKQRLLRARSKLADLYCKWKYGVTFESSYIWCPSQITGTHPDLPGIEVYCRWRHNDPWTIRVMHSETYETLGTSSAEYKASQVFRVKIRAAELLRDYANIYYFMNKRVPDYQNFFSQL